jgi:shikimate kinase
MGTDRERAAIVICGPIASGKSTLAKAVARELEQRGLTAATVDLDLVYEMLEHASALSKDDQPTWSRARRVAAGLTDALLDDGLDVVVAEGDFLEEVERAEFGGALRAPATLRFVTLSVALETALVRVQQDPTRVLSRDPVFLTRHYEELAGAVRTRPDGDLCVDTGSYTVGEAADIVVEWALAAPGPRS